MCGTDERRRRDDSNERRDRRPGDGKGADDAREEGETVPDGPRDGGGGAPPAEGAALEAALAAPAVHANGDATA